MKLLTDPMLKYALDIFMLLNKNNDGFVGLDECKPLWDIILILPNNVDRGRVHTAQNFEEIFLKLNRYNLDVIRFKEFVDKLEINILKCPIGSMIRKIVAALIYLLFMFQMFFSSD